MDNLYKDLKPCLSEIEKDSNDSKNLNNQVNNVVKSEFKSKLSPHAPAFVPRFSLPVQNTVPQLEQNNDTTHLMDDNIENFVNENDYFVITKLRNFIKNVSANPGLFDEKIESEVKYLNKWLDEEPDILLQCAVKIIMDQAIYDANFRYNGVRFCLYLFENLRVTSCLGSFKKLLLQKCKKNTLIFKESNKELDDEIYLRGLTFFIGELSSKTEESDLNWCVIQLLETLVKTEASENIKCCCQVLKMCGKKLSQFLENTEDNKKIESLFNDMSEINKKKELERSAKNLLEYTMDLFKNNWITPQPSAPLYNPYAKNHIDNYVNDMYDNNDYNQDYDFGPCGDEKDLDVCDAFEEFLKLSGQT